MGWFRKDLGLYDVMPRGWRPAWDNVGQHKLTCYWIGVHWIAKAVHWCWRWSWRYCPDRFERHDRRIYFAAQHEFGQRYQASHEAWKADLLSTQSALFLATEIIMGKSVRPPEFKTEGAIYGWLMQQGRAAQKAEAEERKIREEQGRG